MIVEKEEAVSLVQEERQRPVVAPAISILAARAPVLPSAALASEVAQAALARNRRGIT